MNKTPKIAIIVPAAGVGSRMQLSHPKQYLDIGGKTVLEHTLDTMLNIPDISIIAVAISKDDVYFTDLNIDNSRIIRTPGGRERSSSVLNALNILTDYAPDWVLVHDAARPLVAMSDIIKLITQCIHKGQGGILAAKVKDTIKRGNEYSLGTVPRDELWQALTPQMFPFEALHNALESALSNNVEITDEASAMEWNKEPVQLIAGRSDNIKITTPEDYALASFLISQQQKESAK